MKQLEPNDPEISGGIDSLDSSAVSTWVLGLGVEAGVEAGPAV